MRAPAMKCAVIACAMVVASVAPASAQVVWSWSFGSEQGTLTTDGSFADTASVGTFTITDFQITGSAYPAYVGATTYETQAPQGFLWDGSAPTQFWRLGGTYTNGADFFLVQNDWFYVFNPGLSELNNADEDLVLEGTLTLVPLNDTRAGIPTLSFPMMILFLILMGLAGVWLLRR